MMHTTDKSSTRNRILDAAQTVFLDYGYHIATLRDICGRAGVNISAVKYHFRDKEGLYLAVLDRLFQQSVESQPLDDDLMDSAPPEERLREVIRNMLARILGKGHRQPDPRIWSLIAHELTKDSHIMRSLANKYLYSFKSMLWDIVAELLDLDKSHPAVRDCSSSVVGQYTHYLYGLPIINLFNPEHPITTQDFDRLSDHITRFSLAGIRSARDFHHQQG